MDTRGRRIVYSLLGLFGLVVLAVGIGAVVIYQSLDRVQYGLDEARERLGASPQFRPRLGASDDPADDEDALDVYLIVGSDEREDLGGSRADAIMLGFLPDDDEYDPGLVSLPRDLWIEDLCGGGKQRINAALNGCGDDASGEELMILTVENFTGVPVDHYIELDMEAFEDVIDSVGGVPICTDHPVRGGRLDLPGGCVNAGSEQALAWVRSRTTQEYVDGEWRTMPGVDDRTRNERQQEVLLAVADRALNNRSVDELQATASDLADSMVIGDSLGPTRMVNTAWSNRNVRPSRVERTIVEVEPHTTSGGAQVSLPTQEFSEVLEELGLSDAPLDGE